MHLDNNAEEVGALGQYEQFSTCLKRILETERMSASQLARELGLRSRTSIFRILTDQTSVRVQEDFLSMLHKHFADVWPQQHWMDLHRALEINRIGLDDYVSRNAFRSLIKHGGDNREILLNTTLPPQEESEKPFRQVLRDLVAEGNHRITVCGCCNASLCQLLAEELVQPGREGRLYVRHFVNMNESVAVQNMVSLQPLLYFSWYDPLIVDASDCAPEMAEIYTASSIIVEKTADAGAKSYSQFLMHDDSHLFLVSHCEQGMNQICMLLDYYAAKLKKLKAHFPCNLTLDDYVRYTDDYRQLEHDREVMSIKPDVPINYIHPDILLPVLMDGFRDSQFTQDQNMMGYVQQFYDIHMARYMNFLRKRKVTHVVFSLDAMRNFMLTGQQSDHFFAMRPYTLAERLAILNHLRDETLNNPYFSIRFLKPEFSHPGMEITLYDGAGVLFTKSDTHYDLSGDHSEALVSNSCFAQKFREFFIRELLPKHVMSHKDSLEAMNQLMREAAKFG